MALSYLTESEAPRDFRVSSTDSDAHYTKCLLCYTVKRNFYCPDCIRSGNFVHTSMPYSDRFAEKQAKLLRLKANRQHVLDRCEKLLAPKLKKDTLLTEAKQSRDRIDLLKLAIEQRRNNIHERKKELTELINYNNELKLKLPRYQKRVASLGRHVQLQDTELQQRVCACGELAQGLAALRRSRVRHLVNYIFPVYITYDSSDSIEDMEFVGDDIMEEPPKRAQLHIVAPWVTIDGDFAHLDDYGSTSSLSKDKESAMPSAGSPAAPQRSSAAIGFLAQLTALLAAILDARLPYPLSLTEYWLRRAPPGGGGGAPRLRRRLCACAAALCARAGLSPPPPASPPSPLAALHALCVAAAADVTPLGRVETWMSSSCIEAWSAWEAACYDKCERERDGHWGQDADDTEPEHLTWPEEHEVPLPLPGTPPAPPPAASLVTSLASLWRGWTK